MGEALNHIHQNTKSARLIAVNKGDEAISIYQSPGLISKILKHITITICIRSLHYTTSHTPSRTVGRIYALIKKTISMFSISTGYSYKIKTKKKFPQCSHTLYRNTRGSLGTLTEERSVIKSSKCFNKRTIFVDFGRRIATCDTKMVVYASVVKQGREF